jgi:hypothetical protein
MTTAKNLGAVFDRHGTVLVSRNRKGGGKFHNARRRAVGLDGALVAGRCGPSTRAPLRGSTGQPGWGGFGLGGRVAPATIL